MNEKLTDGGFKYLSTYLKKLSNLTSIGPNFCWLIIKILIKYFLI